MSPVEGNIKPGQNKERKANLAPKNLSNVQVSLFVTLTMRLKPLSGTQEAVHELAAEQHVSHWLRDNDINHVWTSDVVHFALKDPDPLRQTVAID